MNIKGKGTVIRYIVRSLARKKRQAFINIITKNPGIIYKQINTGKKIAVSLVSFSSGNDLPEQLLSIFSFVHYCGEPEKWTIYSDGTHTSEDEKLLSFFPFIELIFTPFQNILCSSLKTQMQPYHKSLADYASKHPLGKKLLCFLNHPVNSPTIFLDSDILFYQKAGNISSIIEHSAPGAFLQDIGWGCLDEVYKKKNKPEPYQANSGFFFLSEELNMQRGLEHLQLLSGSYHYFSEQTTFHIIFNTNNLQPLDRELFFISTSDQFSLSYTSQKQNIALRHYTGPVRYKMWQKNWKWHLLME